MKTEELNEKREHEANEAGAGRYDENLALLAAYRGGDRAAGERLAVINRPLVCKIAGKFAGRGVDGEELVAIGNVGLVKAMNTFDFSRDCAFSTYAVPLVFGEIRRFLRDDGMIKVSRENKRLSATINAERERRINSGEAFSLEDIAAAIGVSVQDAAMALFSSSSVRSLDEAAFDDGEGATLGATVCDDDEEARSFDRLALRLALDRLAPFERKLIILRYFRDMSQAKTAEILGLSQVKVSRTEKKILAALREYLS